MFRCRRAALSTVLFLCTAVAAIAGHGAHENAPTVTVSAEYVKERAAGSQKTALIDVRSLQEYKAGHIPGAVNIPSSAVKMLKDRLPKDASTLIIIYARGDSHSPTDTAFNAVFKMGYKNLKLFRGGVRAWIGKKYTMKKGTQP